ncbi:MAG: GerMN domain-containing protein [Firmicutes bacterium]|nr:GerMN domain-containing protein [Bacillota bacterium]
MKRKVTLLSIVFTVIILLVLAGGCALFQKSEAPGSGEINNNFEEPDGDEEDAAPGGDSAPGETSPGNNEGKEGNEAEDGKVRITLYFGDKKAIEEGSPCNTGYVSPVVREFPHTTAVLCLALEELIRGPLPGEENLVRTLPATVEILNIKIENEVALIDFSSEIITDSPGGTLGGSILIQSLVYTVTEFPTVKSVLVTVEGETFSDGHFIWENPISREYFSSSG